MAFVGRTLKFTRIDDLLLIVHSPVDPDLEEWNTLMVESRTIVHPYRRCLVYSADVKLRAKQRSQLADVVNGLDLKVAVLADSAVTRGMVTALGWVTGKYRAFPLEGIEAAVTYLGGNLDPAKVRAEIQTLQRTFSSGKSATG